MHDSPQPPGGTIHSEQIGSGGFLQFGNTPPCRQDGAVGGGYLHVNPQDVAADAELMGMRMRLRTSRLIATVILRFIVSPLVGVLPPRRGFLEESFSSA